VRSNGTRSDRPDRPDLPDRPGLWDPLDLRDPWDPLDLRDRWDSLDRPGLWDPLDLRDPWDPLGHPARHRQFGSSPARIAFAAETTKSWLLLFARAVRPTERSARFPARQQPGYVYVGDLCSNMRIRFEVPKATLRKSKRGLTYGHHAPANPQTRRCKSLFRSMAR
jgi:hypothetical protein